MFSFFLYKLRGVGGHGDEQNNIVLLEEAAFIEPDVRDEIILPLLKIEGTVLLTISTLGPLFDSWKEITERVDERGKAIFLVKTYSLVCDDCMEKGIPQKCLHKQDLLPRWQSAEAESKVKAVMSGNLEAYYREALGIQGDLGYIAAFDPAGLRFLKKQIPPREVSKELWDEYRKNPLQPPTCLVDKLLSSYYENCFISVDPSAGSTRSNYAVISMVYEKDGTVVVRKNKKYIYILLLCSSVEGKKKAKETKKKKKK